MSVLQLVRRSCRVCRRSFSRRRFASNGRNATPNYIDEWQASIVKPLAFYEENSAPGLKRKNYFYNIDLQGRVFLEETLPKNIATSIKNVDFLNFFFCRLQRVGPKQRIVLQQLNVEEDYPFVSPCGPELNFVRPADLPIVFHGLQKTDDDETVLVFGGSLVQPFHPDKLALSPTTGRLYHELIGTCDDVDKRVRLMPLHASTQIEYGLIRSSVAVSLSDSIIPGSYDESDTLSGMDFICQSSDCRFPIKLLPKHAQAGPWSMPFLDEME